MTFYRLSLAGGMITASSTISWITALSSDRAFRNHTTSSAEAVECPIPSKRKVNVKSSGTIEETAFLQTLRLKVGARVMVIHNINTNDGLTNGAQGEVVDILEKEGRIHYVLVRFDNPNIGEEQRRTHRNLPLSGQV